MLTRRFLLRAAGASAVVIGAGAGAYAVLSPSIASAQEPWLRAGQRFGDPRLDALAFAILAPSPHNRQPWLIRLEGSDELLVFCQLDRRLPRTDPLDRQIVIGFGAFLELLRMAAAKDGIAVDITPFPEGTPVGRLDARPVARVRFTAAGAEADPLFAEVLRRRTVRTPFSPEVPAEQALAGIFAEAMTGFSSGGERHAALRAFCLEGWQVEHAYAPTRAESTALTRIGAAEVVANPDGIALYGAPIEAARLTGALSQTAMDQPGSWAHRQVETFYSKAIEASPVFGWLLGADDSQVERLDAGRRWLRLHLAATREGLGFQPLSQVLQEFAPMAPLLERVHALLAPEGQRVHGLFRLGLASNPPPAPRWQLETRLVEAT